ncbi:aldehyde dehydrogenase family protein [Granulicella sp. L60]|uniref:aldehyde dehydrogenase family protein n=1 Tax=Granulicella sp. L60 TaxID=1641866 RepID=UPI0020B12F5B|nr:aldehyde dehydrogenase family protein [Granulicella sp. L60]
MFVGGWRGSRVGVSDVTDKASGEILATVALATSLDVSEACQVAVRSGAGWASVSAEQRAALLRRAIQLLETHKDEVIYWLVRESGSTKAKANEELLGAKAHLAHSADVATKPSRQILKDDAEMLSYCERVPLGVVGVIGPFNYPLILSLRFVAAALAMGNAVVLKPSLNTAVSGGILIARLFEEAGLPKGVLQVIPGEAEVGSALVEDPNVTMIAFTGSTSVGKKIGAKAGAALKRMTLELGGKSPFVVLGDADLDLAARAGAFSTFFHQGQVCMAPGLHIVHQSIFNAYSERVAELAKAIRVGDPYRENVGLGPIINEKQRDRVHSIIEEAVAAGAQILEGGTFRRLFYRPTVLINVPHHTRAFTEEIFGPVAVIVPFDDELDALRLANGTGYGLAASVFGELEHAKRFGKQIQTGMLHINDRSTIANAKAPVGGTKASGNVSRVGHDANIEDFTTWLWVTETRRLIGYEINPNLDK